MGDNFYENGVTSVHDAHWTQTFENVYHHPSLQVPWYSVLGNHDWRGRVAAQVAYTAMSTRWRMPATYYQQTFSLASGQVADIFFLDTTPLLNRYHWGGVEYTPGVEAADTSAQLAWLERALRSSAAAWKLVVGHHPIISGSPFHGGAAELQAAVLPLLEQYGVDAYLCGHEHDAQHLTTFSGLNTFVVGNGSEARLTGWARETQFATSSLGFAHLTLTTDQLTVTFFDETARPLYETQVSKAMHASSELVLVS